MPARRGKRFPVTSSVIAKIARRMHEAEVDSHDLAKAVGADRATIQRLLDGKIQSSSLLPVIFLTLELDFEASLAAEDGAPYFVVTGDPVVPIVGYVGAGEKYYPDPSAGDWSGFDEVEAPPKATHDTVAVRIAGNSMEPRYRSGEVVFFRRDGDFIPDVCIGRDCVVQIRNGPAYIKRVERHNGQLRLVSYRDGVAAIEAPDIEWASPILWMRPS